MVHHLSILVVLVRAHNIIIITRAKKCVGLTRSATRQCNAAIFLRYNDTAYLALPFTQASVLTVSHPLT